jgi:hypothetical protein
MAIPLEGRVESQCDPDDSDRDAAGQRKLAPGFEVSAEEF